MRHYYDEAGLRRLAEKHEIDRRTLLRAIACGPSVFRARTKARVEAALAELEAFGTPMSAPLERRAS